MTDLTRQQRFARDATNNINRGIGGHAFRQKGYSYPTHEEMDQFKKYNLPFDIDQQLRKPIIALNQCGYKTGGSCSGHRVGERGFIAVNLHPPTDQYFNELKRKNPERYQEEYQFYKKEGGYSSIPINPDQIKSIIKRYTNTKQVYYKPPGFRIKGNAAVYHSFTFPALANKWG